MPTPAYTLWQHCSRVSCQPGQAGKCSFMASHCCWVIYCGQWVCSSTVCPGRQEDSTGRRIPEVILESEFNLASTKGECEKQTQGYRLQAWLDPGEGIRFCAVAILGGLTPGCFDGRLGRGSPENECAPPGTGGGILRVFSYTVSWPRPPSLGPTQ